MDQTPGTFAWRSPRWWIDEGVHEGIDYVQPKSMVTLWQTNVTMETSAFLMGKSTISMAIFNSYVSLPEGIFWQNIID